MQENSRSEENGSCGNDDIRAQLRQEGVVEQVGRKREVWKKRVEEHIGSMTETVMSGAVPGKRPGGRPRKHGDGDDESLLTLFLLYGLSMIQLISHIVCAVVNAGVLQCKR